MDYRTLPSDADSHHRTKWSNDLFLYIDDDAGSPSLYMFDRSGKPVFSSMMQIPGVDRMRVDDFAAAPDGSVWAGGNASSATGQRSFFLAHVGRSGEDIQIVRTTPYRPCQLSVASDGTVWTIGYEVTPNADGQIARKNLDPNLNVLRHFDKSGELISSGVPLGQVGPLRALTGYLVATPDRIGWYSPARGVGVYVEFSPEMKILRSYPSPPATDRGSGTWGFALTPAGNAFVSISHLGEGGPASTLYQLDRTTSKWITVDVPRDPNGNISMVEGSDGESLILLGLPDKSKLQVFDVVTSAPH